MGSVLNLIHDDFYYVKKPISGFHKRYPVPNGYIEEVKNDFLEMMNYYEVNFGDKESVEAHNLQNSHFDEDYYDIVPSLKSKKKIPVPQVKIHHPFLTKELGRKFNLVYVDGSNDVLDEDVYFYVIEPLQLNWKDETQVYKNKETNEIVHEGEWKVFDCISDNVVKLINEKRCKVIIDYSHEAVIDMDNLQTWYEKVKKENRIDLSQVYFFLGDLNTDRYLDCEITMLPSIYYLELLSGEVYDIKQEKSHKTGLGYNYSVPKIENLDIDKKDKHFLCLMRNCSKSHRLALASLFEHYDIWYNNKISFLKHGLEHGFEENFHLIPSKYKDASFRLRNLDPVKLDTQNFKQLDNLEVFHTNRKDFYDETFLSIVAESGFELDEIELNEKTYKPIWNLHPFILVSTPNALKVVQELGFKTFHPFIDETYDTIKDNKKRMEKICLEIEKFMNKSVEELKEWTYSILPILEHNQKTFFSYKDNETRKVKFLEGFL